MEVLVAKIIDQSTKDTAYTSISLTIKYDNDEPFEYEVKKVRDDIHTWYAVLQFLDVTKKQELNKLLNSIPDLLKATIPYECHDTYFLLLQAIFKWLPEARNIQDPRWLNLFDQLGQALFHFETSDSDRGFYPAVFSCNSEEKLKVLIPLIEFSDNPISVSQVILTRAYQERKDDALYFIDNYRYFQQNIAKLAEKIQKTNEEQTTVQTFVNLSKALVILIKQNMEDLAIYESLIPEICTFIIKHETRIEEQKRYLEYILESREHERDKKDRLNEIIKACRSQQQTDETQFIQVISIISDHYLKLYDFEQSVYFWEQAGTRDFVLKFFLSFHKHPLFYLLIQVGLLIVLFFGVWLSSLFHWQIPAPFDAGVLPTILSWIPPVLILLAVGAVVLCAVFKSKYWLYSQLLFPRLVGAAIVGMFPLLFNSQSWLVGLQSKPIPWLLLLLLTYISSFAYMFIEVYKTMKFVKGHPLEEALRTSVKVFCIAACETLVIVTVTSMFMFPTIEQSLGPSILTASVPSIPMALPPGIPVDLPWLSFSLFPSLILLWGGFALFIGSFVQLLWQDRRITDSI